MKVCYLAHTCNPTLDPSRLPFAQYPTMDTDTFVAPMMQTCSEDYAAICDTVRRWVKYCDDHAAGGGHAAPLEEYGRRRREADW